MVVTFLGGPALSRMFDAPVTVGLRPGHIYRLRLQGFPGYPQVSLYPSLEVRGALCLPPQQRAADHPAPVVFHDADIRQALDGTLVTKVIVLENPETALPVAAPDDGPREVPIAPGEDAVEYAKALGRPVLIVRIGQREPDAYELARFSTGQILFPGDKFLPPGAGVPGVAGAGQSPPCCPPYPGMHPVPGLHCVPAEECLRDGGDRGGPAYLDRNGKLQGLDPADSVAEYTDATGRRALGVTNIVCLCVPRFLAVVHRLPPAAVETVRELVHLRGDQEQRLLGKTQGSRRMLLTDVPDTLRSRQQLQANVVATPTLRLTELQVLQAVEMKIGPAILLGTEQARTLTEVQKARLVRQVQLAVELSRLDAVQGVVGTQGTQVIGIATGLGQVIGTLETCEVVYLCVQDRPELPAKPLQLLKWVSTHTAQIGDVVTFYIKYSNVGGRPIRDIAVSDSLTARLEYIPGSARSDREATFVTQENEAGSLILRWEIRDPLPRCQHGVVSFQARIR
jgi:uncharacterized repeat protein (TIGR01451 family)